MLVRNLSVAQMQLVEIVKAISLSCQVIVMDEPTSAITQKEVKTLFEQIQRPVSYTHLTLPTN
jgi:ABC-type sugar transport system ATPase subunit